MGARALPCKRVAKSNRSEPIGATTIVAFAPSPSQDPASASFTFYFGNDRASSLLPSGSRMKAPK